MALDFTSLVNAIARLEEGQARYLADPSDQQIRDGLIQRFEFTFDLGHKMLRRYLLESSAASITIEEMSFAALVRSGDEAGLLLNGWPRWRDYREARNITSHTYDEDKALKVVAGIASFIAEARFLRDRLIERSAAL